MSDDLGTNQDPALMAQREPRTGCVDVWLAKTRLESLPEIGLQLRQAQTAWASHSIEHRAKVVQHLAQCLEDCSELLISLIADTGREALAALEIQATVAMILRVSAAAPGYTYVQQGQSAIPNIEFKTQGVAFPLVGVISPWNFPLLLSFIDCVPALLAGCAVWIKPSEVTSRFVIPLRKVIEGIPDLSGVLTILIGDGELGAAVVRHSDAICFTGSVETGKKVYRGCAEAFIPAFLELGGKDPLIILPGADLDRAAEVALRAAIISNGQACQSIERVYVHADDEAALVEKLLARLQNITLSIVAGTGQQGPFIFAKQAEIVQTQIDDAVAKGAKVLHGGRIEHTAGGLWLLATLLIDVTHEMRIMREETFGPVLPIMRYQTLAEAVSLANDSHFGLSAAVIGEAALALSIAEQLQAGAVSINDAALTAFVHDVEKQAFRDSGLGASRMGEAGIMRFLRKRAFLIQTGLPFPLSMLNERRVL